VDEAALRHGAGVERETSDELEAYASVTWRRHTTYRNGWLPDWSTRREACGAAP
jgi:hypothetical protein